MITAQHIKDLTDLVVRQYDSLIGHPDTGHGIGNGSAPIEEDWGYSFYSRKMLEYVMGLNDYDLFAALGPAARGIVTMTATTHLYGNQITGIYHKLNKVCRASGIPGVQDLETFAAHHNTGAAGPYNCLICPRFDDVVTSIVKNQKMHPSNLYAADVCLHDSNHGTAAGIDESIHAGSCAPVAIVSASRIVDTGTKKLIVTGRVRCADGSIVDNRTFAATVTEPGVVSLTPNTPGDLLLQVTDVRLPSSIADGSVIIHSGVPLGRP